MTDEERMVRILERLIDRSEEGRYEWLQDEDIPDTAFWASLGDWHVRIMSVDSDGEHPFRMSIFGTEEDSGPEVSFLESRLPPESDDDRQLNRNLAQLYRLGRRAAIGADKALDEIEKLLESGL
jgi:hypothetical protein